MRASCPAIGCVLGCSDARVPNMLPKESYNIRFSAVKGTAQRHYIWAREPTYSCEHVLQLHSTIMSYDQKHPLAGKRIVVAGAGLAGLAFARALVQQWPQGQPAPETIIYERSSKTLDRSREGYTMGIKPESGLHALKQLGLLDTALRLSTTTAGGSQQPPTFWTKNWNIMLEIPPPPSSADGVTWNGIRLVRHVLRQILLDALPAEVKVQWEVGCDSAQILDNGKARVSLSDGSKTECDLLVAADGANSGIRHSLLPQEKLEFAGVNCFIGTSRFPSGKPEPLKNRWGSIVTGHGVPFLTFPIDENSGVWATSYRSEKPRDRIKGDEALRRKDEIMNEVKQRCSMLQEPFGEFIEATDPATLQVFSAQHKSPINHSRALPGANVIFIGDANHALSPFSGYGANSALLDAVELAKQLCSSSTIREARDVFDSESAPRSQAALDRSRWVIRAFHSEGITFWLVRALIGCVSFLIWLKLLFKRSQR